MIICPCQRLWSIVPASYPSSVPLTRWASISVRKSAARVISKHLRLPDDPGTYSQVLTLYNPYDFVVRYKSKDSLSLFDRWVGVSLSSSLMYSPTEVLHYRTARGNPSVTLCRYVGSLVMMRRKRRVFDFRLELFGFSIRPRRPLTRMLYIKFAFNSSIVERLKILSVSNGKRWATLAAIRSR